MIQILSIQDRYSDGRNHYAAKCLRINLCSLRTGNDVEHYRLGKPILKATTTTKTNAEEIMPRKQFQVLKIYPETVDARLRPKLLIAAFVSPRRNFETTHRI